MAETEPGRIEESKAFLQRLWLLENDERPGFLIGYAGPRVRGGRPVRSALFSTEGEGTIRDRLLETDLNEIYALLGASRKG